MSILLHGATEVMMQSAGLFLLRAVVGGLLAGHGAQKCFGAFNGPGLAGTAGFLESMGLKPGHYWAKLAATGEFGGGLLTVLGLGGPLGPIMTIAAMLMATLKVHWGKPIWAAEGGAELPAVNMAAAAALALAGPGSWSLDRLFGIRVPRWLSALVAIGALGTVVYGAMAQPEEGQTDQAGGHEGDRSADDHAA
jgi:putative oxidoreductase